MDQKSYKNQRRKPKQARSLEKYNRVLDACSQLLSTQNYSDISMTEISLESGLAYATIYQYFKNKDDIMLAWMDRFFEQIEGLMQSQKTMADSQGNVNLEQQADLMMRSSVTMMAQSQNSVRELFNGMPFMLTSQLLAVIESRTINLVKLLFTKEILEDRSDSPEPQIRVLTKIIIGFYIQSILNAESDIEPERDGEELSCLVLSYLKARSLI